MCLVSLANSLALRRMKDPSKSIKQTQRNLQEGAQNNLKIWIFRNCKKNGKFCRGLCLIYFRWQTSLNHCGGDIVYA